MANLKKPALLLFALVAIAGLAACGGGDGEAGTAASGSTVKTNGEKAAKGGDGGGVPAMTTIVIRGGEPVGGVQELEYGAGEQVRFDVRSDVADEIHVHGYDVMRDVPAGGSVSFSFPAEIEGIFEIELEERGEQIAELRVNP